MSKKIIHPILLAIMFMSSSVSVAQSSLFDKGQFLDFDVSAARAFNGNEFIAQSQRMSYGYQFDNRWMLSIPLAFTTLLSEENGNRGWSIATELGAAVSYTFARTPKARYQLMAGATTGFSNFYCLDAGVNRNFILGFSETIGGNIGLGMRYYNLDCNSLHNRGNSWSIYMRLGFRFRIASKR